MVINSEIAVQDIMKSIAYFVPYFGTLPKGFKVWLQSCKMNSTIDWILMTDDKTKYNYPSNVHVIYTTFDKIKSRIQQQYEFQVFIDRPWKLCDFRPAFGQIFSEELRGYDFWGHCDLDLIWGDIRKFITDDILEKYEKIGFQGHSTLYRNSLEVNTRYKTKVPGKITYKEVFSGNKGYCFDETGMCDIYDHLGIVYFKETNFAHLDMFSTSFFLGHLPQEDDYKNEYQVFVWRNGKLIRKYLTENKIFEEEYLYLHLFCRPIEYKVINFDESACYVVYPDVIKDLDRDIDVKYLKKHGRCSAIHFYTRVAYERRKKLTPKKIIKAIRTKLYNKKNRTNSKMAIKSNKINAK